MIVNVPFNGRLNKDDETLPVGDYDDAKNISILQASKTGGAGSIKKMESLDLIGDDLVAGDIGSTLANPVIKTQTADADGNIYVLVAGDENAVIVKVTQDGVTTEVLKYNHNSCSVEYPDLRIIDGIMIWNYHGSGTPLSWLLSRTPTTVGDDRDIFLIKAAPIYPPSVFKNYSSKKYGSVKGKQFQFATRYIWDTGDVSAISPISEVYGGEDGVRGFIVTLNGSEPSMNYVDKVEYLVREGNNGVWKRFKTKDYAASEDSTLHYYNTSNDGGSSWLLYDLNTGAYLTVNPNLTFPIEIADAAGGVDGRRRTLGTLSAGTYKLKVKSAAFNSVKKIHGHDISVKFILWDTTAAVERASLTFNVDGVDSVESFTSKEIEYTIPTDETYELRIEYTQTTVDTGGFVFTFYPIELISSDESSDGFYGQHFETIPQSETSKQFDYVPYSTQTLDIKDNRLFLGNNTEIKTGDEGSVELNITTSADTYGTDGYSYAYNVVNALPSATKNKPSVSGFAGNSRYGFGIIFMDKFMRTRGLETSKGWVSPDFNVGAADVEITRRTDIPSWAEYYQLVRTKNLDKDYIYEGYASGVHFMIEQPTSVDSDYSVFVEREYQNKVTTETNFNQSDFGFQERPEERILDEDELKSTEISDERVAPKIKITSADGKIVPFLPYLEEGLKYDLSTVGNVKYFVIDIEGMLKSDRPYNFQNGDVVRGHFLSANNQFLDNLQIVETKIKYQQGNLLYCDPSPILDITENELEAYPRADLTGDILENLFFEIYSPKQSSEERYYAVGDVNPISELRSLSLNASLTKTVEGDTVWIEDKISIPSEGFIYQPAYAKLGATGVSVTIGNGGSSSSPSERFSLTETSNYDNNPDFTITDGEIKVHKGGAYRVYYEINFTITNASSEFSNAISYASAELRRSSNHEIVGRAVFTSDGGSGARTIATTTSFEAGSGDSFYLTIIGRQYGSGNTEAVTFNLDHLIIGHTENLVGDLTFGLKRKALDNTTTKTVIFKATSPNSEIQGWNTDIGKPYTLVENKTNVGLDRRVRFGGKKIGTSTYSRLCSFNPSNYKDLGDESGSITALSGTAENQNEGGVLLAICKNETISMYIGVRAVQSSDGSTQLIQSNDFLGSTRTLMGGFGCKHKGSVASLRGKVFFWDDRNKKVVRYTKEGLIPISDYKMASYFRGKTGDCLGFVDPFYGYYHIKFAGEDYTTAFDGYERWVAHFDMAPVCQGTYFDQYMFLAYGTRLYKSLGSTYNSFIGATEEDPYIQLSAVFPEPVELTGLSITSYDYLDYSNAPTFVKASVVTAKVESGTQETTMPSSFFTYEDGRIFSHIYRDQQSSGNRFTGFPIVGDINKIKLTLTDSTIKDSIRQVLLQFEKSFGHIA